MPRILSLLAGLPLLGWLVACAPTQQPPTASPPPTSLQTGASSFRAAFSEAGVAWVSAGRACVARQPSYRPDCPRLAAASDVAWQGDTAWAALPGPGLVVTLDLAPRSLPVGAVAALSSTHVYRRDGSRLTYDPQPAGGVAGGPSAAVTGGDGQDYVLLGTELRRANDGAVLERFARPFLYATPAGAATAAWPTAASGADTYRLTGTALERVAAGQVVARVPHGPGRVGLVRGEVVTVGPAGEVRRFTGDLRPLN